MNDSSTACTARPGIPTKRLSIKHPWWIFVLPATANANPIGKQGCRAPVLKLGSVDQLGFVQYRLCNEIFF